MARVACTVMLKDEVTLTAPFLDYHAALFGFENLYVVDNGTTEPEVLAVLERFESAGGHVDRSFSTRDDYHRKGEIIGSLVQRLDATADYDLYLLLDCDEFVVVKEKSGYSCDPIDIHQNLDRMIGGKKIFRVNVNLSNIPGRPGVFQVADYAKTIFPHGTMGVTDHGHHGGWTLEGNKEFLPCDIAYVHFHYRPYEEVVRFSRQKLEIHLSQEELDDPETLKAYKGRGWHLVGNLLAGAKGYYAQFENLQAVFDFPELTERFRRIGSEMPFSTFVLADTTSKLSSMTVMVDEATNARVRGWAWDKSSPEQSVFLNFRVNERIIWSGICDQPRPDVRESGVPTEAVGFNFLLPDGVLAGSTLMVDDAVGARQRLIVSSIERDDYPLAEAQAGMGPASAGEIYSHVDSFKNGRIQGWALRSVPTPEGPRLLGSCTIAVTYDGQVVARAVAGIPRPDVSVAMQSDDRCGFLIDIPRHLGNPSVGATFKLLVLPENQEIVGSPCLAAPVFPGVNMSLLTT